MALSISYQHRLPMRLLCLTIAYIASTSIARRTRSQAIVDISRSAAHDPLNALNTMMISLLSTRATVGRSASPSVSVGEPLHRARVGKRGRVIANMELQAGDDMQNGEDQHDGAYVALAFYSLSPIADPDASVEKHKIFLADHSILGRVYICDDGINAQVSGNVADVAAYEQFVSDEFPEESILFQKQTIPEHAFPKLRVKKRRHVQFDENLSLRGQHLTPAEWRDRLEDSTPLKLLDVRNAYEWDVGRFQGAERPAISNFRDTTGEALGLDENNKDQDILMYCTGGIRCEYYSAKLKREGYKNVYQLQGGIINYGNEVGAKGWDGKLFVFDRRNTIPVGDGSSKVVGRCIHCGEPADDVHNCCNIDCNSVHIACPHCWEKHKGLCTEACHHGDRIRPFTVYSEAQSSTQLGLEQGPLPGAQDVNKKKYYVNTESESNA